jgi:hypothetical protein
MAGVRWSTALLVALGTVTLTQGETPGTNLQKWNSIIPQLRAIILSNISACFSYV